MNFEYALSLYRLKDEVRTGWLIRGIEQPESVAAHSWGTALLCLLYAQEAGVDSAAAVAMALAHDIPEALTGDTAVRSHTLGQRGALDAKQHREAEAMRDLADIAEADNVASQHGQLSGLWKEYEAGETPIARFVRDMNLIDMCIQALLYLRDGRHNPDVFDEPAAGFPGLGEFLRTTRRRISTPVARRLFPLISAEHDRLVQSGN